jgi:hypothetical protein
MAVNAVKNTKKAKETGYDLHGAEIIKYVNPDAGNDAWYSFDRLA